MDCPVDEERGRRKETDALPALLMCGGRGTRLDATEEKPLFEVGGEPMIDRVLRALIESRAGPIYAVVSPNTPATREHLGGEVSLIETSGDGYVADLETALGQIGPPTLTVAADLPLLASDLVDRTLDAHARKGDALVVTVPAGLKRRLGASVDDRTLVDGLVPAGINVVSDSEDIMYTSYDARLAVNVNRRSDAALAEALLCDAGVIL